MRVKVGQDERGAALLELAIITPLLLFIAAGVFDLTVALNEQTAMSQAAKSAAKLAVLSNATTPIDLSMVTRNSAMLRLAEHNLNPADFAVNIRAQTITIDPSIPVVAQGIQVSISRTAEGRYFFLPQNAVQGCAEATIAVPNGIAPIDIVADPNCG